MFSHSKIKFSTVSTFFLLLLQLIYLSQISALNIVRFNFELYFIIPWLLSFFSLYIFFSLFRQLFISNRMIYVIGELFFIWLYAIMVSYTLKTGSSIDYGVIVDNFELVSFKESFIVIFNSLVGWPLIYAAIATPVILFTWCCKLRDYSPKSTFVFAFYLLLYLLFLFSNIPAFDEYSIFFRSIKSYYSETNFFREATKGLEYPFVVKEPDREKTNKSNKLPHVFIIEIESFSGQVIGKKLPDGRNITPVFNELIKNGLYVENFYGNSIQTAKGQFAILLSLIPTFMGKEFYKFENFSFLTLADILKNSGYKTIFYSAFLDGTFDNTQSFMLRHGFSMFETLHSYVKEEDKPFLWSWGYEDNVLYKRFFEFLEEIDKKETNRLPYFVFLSTISNHAPFDVPPKRRFLFENPSSFYEKYVNSIHLSDKHLTVFFNELTKRPKFNNSIVIITGDHSFPTGEHGFTDNGHGFYEESFRVPCLFIGKKYFPVRIIRENAYSQIDIAPTLLDAINLMPKEHHFLGHSILRSDKIKNPVYLVQPYNGRVLGVVLFPLKYLLQVRTGREFLFDLKDDPKESLNLINEPQYKTEIDELRTYLKTIFLSNSLIHMDRIWPRRH